MEISIDFLKTAKGSLGFMLQNSINSLLGLGFFIILARMISKDEMGVYTGLMVTYSLFQVSGLTGLSSTAARFIAKYLAEGDLTNASTSAKKILQLGTIFSILACITYYTISPYLSLIIAKSFNYTNLFKITSITVLVSSFSIFIDGLMQGIKEFEKLAIARIIAQLFRILVSLILLFLGYGLFSPSIGWIAFGLALIAFSIKSITNHLDLSLKENYPLKPIIIYLIPLLISNLLLFTSNYIDVFMAMVYLKTSELGAYNVAITASSSLILIILASMISTLLPAISGTYGKGGIKAVENAFTKSTRYMAMIYSPAAFGLASISLPLIQLIAGEIYLDSVIPLAIISISSIAYGLSIPILIVFQSLGETFKIFKITFLATLANVLTCILMIPRMNIVGASIGRSVLFLTTLFYSIYEGKKLMGLKFDKKAIIKSIIASLLMFIALLILEFFLLSKFLIPFYIIFGIIIYGLMNKTIKGLSKEDLEIIKKMVPENFKKLFKLIEWFIN
ncbi:MAG: oligosaccharide flippase family protein [Candidatus Bathyarchaeia archaeon]